MVVNLISIVVPAYNSSEWIARCIDSLIGQKYKDIEIILVNDGSTDETLDIMRKYEKKHNNIKIIDIPHSGQSRARNIGIQNSNGEYLCFVDSDDYIDEYYCLELRKAIENVDMAICGVKTYLYEEFFEEVKAQRAEILTNVELIRKILKLDDFTHIVANKMFRRKILESNNLKYCEDRLYEDMVFAYESALCCSSVAIIDQSLYSYMTRKDSTFTTFTSKRIVDYLFAIDIIHQKLSNSDIYLDIKQDYINYLNHNAIHAMRLFVNDLNPEIEIYRENMITLLDLISEVKNIKVRL